MLTKFTSFLSSLSLSWPTILIIGGVVLLVGLVWTIRFGAHVFFRMRPDPHTYAELHHQHQHLQASLGSMVEAINEIQDPQARIAFIIGQAHVEGIKAATEHGTARPIVTLGGANELGTLFAKLTVGAEAIQSTDLIERVEAIVRPPVIAAK